MHALLSNSAPTQPAALPSFPFQHHRSPPSPLNTWLHLKHCNVIKNTMKYKNKPVLVVMITNPDEFFEILSQ